MREIKGRKCQKVSRHDARIRFNRRGLGKGFEQNGEVEILRKKIMSLIHSWSPHRFLLAKIHADTLIFRASHCVSMF